ncbi:MAG: ABC transporter ATP-binding protein [Verrucomicrobia bacterium]|nr:ABC transporter ATP-binding protein [Verrucomicrobiota bacterium]
MNAGLTAHFTKRFRGGATIHIDTLHVPAEAGITVLFGASGSGKTTVLRCLAGLDRPDAGEIRFAHAIWSNAADKSFMPPRHRGVGYVPQDYTLFPHLSVARNIGFGLHHLPRHQRLARVAQTMQTLDIPDLATRFPSSLSGGQQQRVALARAIVTHPRLLLLDEPLSALDTPMQLHLRRELRHWLRNAAIPTVLVTHDRLEALTLGDAIVVMDAGRILQQGPVPDVFSRPVNRAVADIVAVETVQPAHIAHFANGLASVIVGSTTLTALATDLPAGTRDAYVCIRAEDVILTRDAAPTASPRNRLPATVQTILDAGPMLRVTLDCGFPLTALLTKQAGAELSLHENATVHALIKAPQIHVIPR